MRIIETKRRSGDRYAMKKHMAMLIGEGKAVICVGLKTPDEIMFFFKKEGLDVVAKPKYIYDRLGQILDPPEQVGYKFKLKT